MYVSKWLICKYEKALTVVKWPSFKFKFKHKCFGLARVTTSLEEEVNSTRTQEDFRIPKDAMNAPKSSGINRITNVTLPRNTMFTERNEILTQLVFHLEDRSARHQDQDEGIEGSEGGETGENPTPRSCIIHGDGGVGKTEIALEYTYKCGRFYSHIFWLPSENQGLLQEAFHSIFAELDISIQNSDTLSAEKKIEKVREWLQSTDKKWLLVFDNCEDISSLRPFWPAVGQGRIIVTSRNPLLLLLEEEELTNLSIALPPMQTERS
ncbi:hypothetical protein O1611_g6245 [Lasiodiplodia mahajangana]|uniref:Uncharacterized protein n=1 Tax=Lasiodiplodia mahajangana TaxID=1108764 RepID=A0ACC2JJD8_9PEZI|nr:hypothetical protein O1611_g6245 [Lasiodiplodia mahajangana]